MKKHFTLLSLLLVWFSTSLVSSSSIQASPKRPELTPSQSTNENGLDLMWNVLPDKAEEANFGGNVRERFYAVEVVVGNNTGKIILMESLAFSSNGSKIPIASLQIIIPLVNRLQAARLCESAFVGNLILQKDTQARTIVFVPRTLVDTGNGKNSRSAQWIRDRLGRLIVIGRELVDKTISYSAK